MGYPIVFSSCLQAVPFHILCLLRTGHEQAISPCRSHASERGTTSDQEKGAILRLRLQFEVL